MLPAILSSIPKEESPTPDVLIAEQQEPVCGSALGLLGAVGHGIFGHYSSGWPVAYLIATVIFGIGLLIGSLIPASCPQEIAKQSRLPAVDRQLQREPKRAIVGRVSGAIDCLWAQETTPVVGGAPIHLGCKYALSSGLMEITYDTGAKVILQGAVTYKVDSANGGFLSIGKLTARLENRGEGREARNERPAVQRSAFSPQRSSTSEPQIPDPLFTIRTPTAAVTDLGTEFGVTVSKAGATQVHVFKGIVRLHADWKLR